MLHNAVEVTSSSTVDVVVNDNFNVTCGATKFKYKSVALTFSGSSKSFNYCT